MLTRVALCLLLGTAPLAAQESADSPAEGLDLMQEGAEMLLRELMEEVQPGLDEMAQSLAALEPWMRGLLALVDDIGNYEAPELQANGDILIRRKTGPDVPPLPAPEAAPEIPPAPETDI
jgi:hypothetical protein